MKFIDKADKEDKLFNLYYEMIYSIKDLRENIIYLNSIEERLEIILYNLELLHKLWPQDEK